MLDTRQTAYNQRAPKADAVMAATDLDALTKRRVDFESRINEIEQSDDVAALGTAEEQQNWARLKRIDDYLALHPDDPDLDDMRDRLRLLKGVMYWPLVETQKRAVLVKQAREGMPTNTGAFATRVSAVESRMDQLQEGLAALTDKQARFLQDLAIRELEAQKHRIEIYQIQARYELAAIYDKTSDKAATPKPKATP
jgi:hypothetical protein